MYQQLGGDATGGLALGGYAPPEQGAARFPGVSPRLHQELLHIAARSRPSSASSSSRSDRTSSSWLTSGSSRSGTMHSARSEQPSASQGLPGHLNVHVHSSPAPAAAAASPTAAAGADVASQQLLVDALLRELEWLRARNRAACAEVAARFAAPAAPAAGRPPPLGHAPTAAAMQPPVAPGTAAPAPGTAVDVAAPAPAALPGPEVVAAAAAAAAVAAAAGAPPPPPPPAPQQPVTVIDMASASWSGSAPPAPLPPLVPWLLAPQAPPGPVARSTGLYPAYAGTPAAALPAVALPAPVSAAAAVAPAAPPAALAGAGALPGAAAIHGAASALAAFPAFDNAGAAWHLSNAP
ncbi:hypothetical protein HXX76_016169, partial [Chlamydomonas incerta]